MPNRLYNKQVSAKGYKRGGGVSESSKKQELASRPKRKATTKKFIKTAGKIIVPGAAAADAGVKLAKRLGREMGGSVKRSKDSANRKRKKSKKEYTQKEIEANKAEYKKMAKDITPEAAMFLEHGKAFPGFNQARRIRGGLKKGGSALKPVKPSQKGLSKLPTEVRNKMGYMKKGGKVHGK